MLVLIDEIVGWRAGLDDLLARFAHRFGRAEPRRQALAYLVGLLSPLASKNGWTRMLERAITAGLPARWVTADEAYGQDSKFRTWLQQHRMGYVLAVPCNQRVPTTVGNSRPDVLAANAPALVP
ncbi:transposase [Micromonospora sp. NPDC049903]|uniref:transposase n=1 Tax=Micromonospora sp. NPDC049903 TaxID=3364276 RepID=UPI003794069C